MSVIGILAVAAAVVLAAVVLEIYREIHYFRVTRYSLSLKKLRHLEKEIRIIFLSDLHNKVYGQDNDVLLRAIRREAPDLILIGGDMLVGKAGVTRQPAYDFVRQLPEICPVFYANGNHEQRMKEMPEKYDYSYRDYRERLKQSGIIFLENESRRIMIHGLKLNVSGLELPLTSYEKFKKQLVRGTDVAEQLGFWPGGKNGGVCGEDELQILLAHNPAYAEGYKEWGADMILSGHLHGGIVRLPGIGGVITPQAFLFPKYSGEMTVEGEQAVIVSKGLGTHTIDIRLFNMPEVVLVTLKKPL